MNMHVSNKLLSGVVAISGNGYNGVQFPSVSFTQPVIITCPSGNLFPTYFASSGITLTNSMEVLPSQGFTAYIDDLNLLWGWAPSGTINKVAYFGG